MTLTHETIQSIRALIELARAKKELYDEANEVEDWLDEEGGTYHYLLKRKGEVIDCTDIDEQNEELAREILNPQKDDEIILESEAFASNHGVIEE